MLAYQENFAEALGYYVQALSAAEGMNSFYRGAAQVNLGSTLVRQGKYEEGRRYYESALALARERGDVIGIVFIRYSQANLAMTLQDYRAAQYYLQELVRGIDETASSTGELPSGKSAALNYQAMVLAYQSRFKEARRALEESLDMGLEGFLRVSSSEALLGVALVLSKVWLAKRQAGLAEQVACLGGAIEAAILKVGRASNFPFQTYYAEALEAARSGLDEATFKAAFARGQAMPLEEAIAFARQALTAI
jgi:tetratricopeptide (TPR) repeat protein